MKPSGFINNLLLRGLIGKGIIDSITLGIGMLWVAIDSKKQGLHDKVAGTIVVYERFMKK